MINYPSFLLSADICILFESPYFLSINERKLGILFLVVVRGRLLLGRELLPALPCHGDRVESAILRITECGVLERRIEFQVQLRR